MLRSFSFDQILTGKYVESSIPSSFLIKGVPVFVFGNRKCNSVSTALSFRSSSKYTNGFELIIASVLFKKV